MFVGVPLSQPIRCLLLTVNHVYWALKRCTTQCKANPTPFQTQTPDSCMANKIYLHLILSHLADIGDTDGAASVTVPKDTLK